MRQFCRRKTTEDNNAKINVSPNISYTFLLFKASAFLQIYFPRNLLVRQVLRTPVFFNGKCLTFFCQFISLLKNIHYRSSHQRCSVKKMFLKISQNSPENTCACNFITKETLAQVFFCKFCEISKNTFSYRTPPVAASAIKNIKQNNTHSLIY